MLNLRQHAASETTELFDLRDRGLLLADGVFDTSLMIKGEVQFRAAHLDRLLSDSMAIELNVSRDEIDTLLRPIEDSGETGALRITITRGPSDRGAGFAGDRAPTLLAQLNPAHPSQAYQPLSLTISDILRNSSSPTSRHKTLNYLDNVLAMRRAHLAGFDNALFKNEADNLCCTAIGNIFLEIDGQWRTPPQRDGVLPGIMRNWLLKTAPILRLDIIEAQVSADALSSVTGAIMTNSLRLLAPIRKIGEHQVSQASAKTLIQRVIPALPMTLADWAHQSSRSDDA